jgi:hypothetical protein
MNNRHFRAAPLVLVAALTLAGLTACGDDDSSASTDTTIPQAAASGSPEDKISPDDEVAKGLKKVVTEAEEIGSGTDAARAAAAYEEAHETWEEVEGTVREKEPDIYAEIETDLVNLKKAGSGDFDSAKPAAEDLDQQVDSYLEKHPG